MKGILIYSDTCPKCRLLRKVVAAIDVRRNLNFLSWRRASRGILLQYYTVNEVPYNYMWLSKDTSLYEGVSAIPLILKALFN